MKRIILGLFAVALFVGCSTTPSSPKPDKTKYAFQCLQVTAPDSLVQKMTFNTNAVVESYSPLKKENLLGKQERLSGEKECSTPAVLNLTDSQIEGILKSPDVEVHKFPVVYADLGESVTNDQTKSVSLPEDYEVVDGKAVAKEKICKLGDFTSVRVDKIENGAISYHLTVSHRELVGFDEYKIEHGLEVKMPFFEARSIDTSLTQQPNSWSVIGGFVHQKSDGEKMHQMICVRVIPPNAEK